MSEIKLTTKKLWPTTIDGSISILDATLSDKDKQNINNLERKNLHLLYPELGRIIREGFGLDEGNDELITATLETDPELAAKTIIHDYWVHLHSTY